jgi:hypothetical protein
MSALFATLKAAASYEGQSEGISGGWKTSLLSKLGGASSEVTISGLSTISAFPFSTHSSTTFVSDEQSQTARNSVLKLYRSLTKASSEDLEAGNRMVEMERVFADWEDRPNELSSALPRVLQTGGRDISSEAKAAAIRYLGIYDFYLQKSVLTSVLLDAVQSDDYLCSRAAAQSLEDVADVWSASNIAATIPRVKNAAVRQSMRATVDRVKGIDDVEASAGA